MSETLPTAFVERIKQQFGDEAGAFLASLNADSKTSVQKNPFKPNDCFDNEASVGWYAQGRILKERPVFTLDPLFHAGAYYPQESSSMFVSYITEQLFGEEEDLVFLDACAAPGGKSINLSSFLGYRGVLVSNEVHKQRNAILRENLTKWGIPNFICTNSETSAFTHLPEAFDLVLIDAPCSGEGMFRKDPDARKEWSTAAVTHCATRQSSILDDLMPSVKPGGYMIYSTCTFAPEENELQVAYILANNEWEAVDIAIDPSWPIAKEENMYRFLPHRVPGEGFFLAVFRKRGIREYKQYRLGKTKNYFHLAGKKEMAALATWFDPHHSHVLMNEKSELFLTTAEESFMAELARHTFIAQCGLPVGTVIRNEFVPEHGLAMLADTKINTRLYELNLQQALQYLRKDELTDLPIGDGWWLLTHKGFALGWMKVIGKRANNYYPKEWRIKLKLDPSNQA